MPLDEKIDDLTDLVKDHQTQTRVSFEKVFDKLEQHTAQDATLIERTEGFEKRMDRTDKRSGAIGAGTGLAGGFLGAFIRSLFGGTGGG